MNVAHLLTEAAKDGPITPRSRFEDRAFTYEELDRLTDRAASARRASGRAGAGRRDLSGQRPRAARRLPGRLEGRGRPQRDQRLAPTRGGPPHRRRLGRPGAVDRSGTLGRARARSGTGSAFATSC